MESLFSVELPIAAGDLLAIEQIVLEAGILFPGNYLGANPPRAVEYQHAAFVEEGQFFALFDRNLISRLARLAAGKPVPEDVSGAQATRIAAAALCFCVLGDIIVEPSIALYELADTQGHDSAKCEERLFRIADNCVPQALANVALGKAMFLEVADHVVADVDRRYARKPISESNFNRPLSKWKLHYLHVLKAAELRRSSNTPLQAAHEMLRWQFEEEFSNSAASLYCLNAISHHPPKGRMLKDFRSEDPQKLCRGIRNATWDIFLLSEFKKRLNQADRKLWSFWTADIALRAVAAHKFVRDSSDIHAKLLEDLISRWGERDGHLLAKEYFRLTSATMSDAEIRQNHLDDAFVRVSQMIHDLEAKLAIPLQLRWKSV